MTASTPTPCPCCGAYSLLPDVSTTTLVAVCDVLVVKALERVGNHILRQPGRGRHVYTRATPKHLIHTVEQAPDEFIARALRGAWDVVPAIIEVHGCCGVTSVQVTELLDDYVHDLVITGTPHGNDELRYRFQSRLGLSLPEHAHA